MGGTPGKEAKPVATGFLDDALIGLAPVGLSYGEEDGTVVYVNQRWRELTGCDAELPIPLQTSLDLVHRDDHEAIISAFRDVNEAEEISVRVRSSDLGGNKRLALTMRRISPADHERIRFIATVSDISELTEAIEEGRRSETRFASVTAALPVGVFRALPDGSLTWANPRMEELAGYVIEEFRGASVFAFTHPDDREDVYTRALDALGRQEPFESHHRFLRSDGSVRWVISRSSPVLDETGHIVEHVGTIEDITELHRRSEDLAHEAAHDQLTNLLNRSSLIRAIESIVEHDPDRHDVGLVFIDLDGFKEVNDTFGHNAGDEVLVEVARRLAQVTRTGDTVGRYGGDEFLIICPGIDDAAILDAVAARVCQVIEEAPVVYDDHEHHIGASVGTAVGPGTGSIDELLHTADEAMYAAKRRKRSDITSDR